MPSQKEAETAKRKPWLLTEAVGQNAWALFLHKHRYPQLHI
jgi:hypothetical protein